MDSRASRRAGRYGRRSTGEKDRECQFCKKKFFRSDILRRHYKTCPSRGAQPIPGPLKKGKQRRACDFCAKSKLSCDFESPCESCLASGIDCTYQRILDDPHTKKDVALQTDDDSEQADFSTVGPSCQEASPILGPDQPPKPSAKASIPFLLNYTNPETKSLADTFGYSSGPPADFPETPRTGEESFPHIAALSDELPSNIESLSPETYSFPAFLDNENLTESLLPGYFFPISDGERKFLQGTFDQSTLEDEAWLGASTVDLLMTGGSRTNELVDHLTELSLCLPQDHPQTAPNPHLARGIGLFEQSNIQKFIRIYFHQWHRHSPILHKGTFDADTVALPLLLAVVLTGALYSSDQDDVSMAQSMLDLAEECAFRDPVFVKLVVGVVSEQDSVSGRALQSIQAAFSISQIHLRGGTLEKRNRCRSDSFDKLLSACRTISLSTTRDTPALTELLSNEDWQEWAENQARIRLICGIFNLDASFTIFYGMQPRLRIEDLAIDMPCSVPLFLAQTASECHDLYLAESFNKHRFPLVPDVVGLFFEESWSSDTQQMMDGLTVLHFFVLVLGILQIWVSNRTGPQRMVTAVVCRALSRWKMEWDKCIKGMDESQLEQAGFMRFAAVEFYYLGETLLEKDRELRGASF